MKIREIMKRGIASISMNASLIAAAQRMRDLDIGMLPVEQDGEIVGTVTDRDITIRATASGADPNSTPVGAVMSTEVFSCVEDDDLLMAARIMREYQIRRLMIQDNNGEFIGMLSIADLARHAKTDLIGSEILKAVSRPSRRFAAAH